MITRYHYKQITWIDVVKPTPEEVREIVMEASIPGEFTNDLGVTVPHSESFAKRGHLKLTLDFPVVHRTDMKEPHEVKFIVSKSHLVTFHYEEMEAIHRFGKEFEVRCLLKNGVTTTTPRLFITMLNYLYDATYLKLDHLESRLHEVEEGIFGARERQMVFEISDLTRRLISFRQVLGGHDNAFDSLTNDITVAFGQKFATHVTELKQRHEHLSRRLRALTSAVEDMRNTNMALLSTKENEIMKLLTILAFVTYPLTLFTSTFGMNTDATPIVGGPHDFWIIITIMVVVSIGFFVFFRYKGWL
jgi:magnesium transporter